MKKFIYTVEIYAVKELVVFANSEKEADKVADLVTSTSTIPVQQEDIADILISDRQEER